MPPPTGGSREVRKVRRFNAGGKGAVLLCGKLGLELGQAFGVFGRAQCVDQVVQFAFDDAV